MKVKLSENQLRKLKRGHNVQLSKDAVKCNGSGVMVDLALHPKKMTKLRRAERLGKGCRLCLDSQEIEGSGILDLLKKGAKTIKKGLKTASKVVGKKKFRESLTKGVQSVASFAPAPVKMLADRYADDLVDYIGDKTGAFGVVCCSKCKGKGFMPAGSGFRAAGEGFVQQENMDYDQLLKTDHPAYHPKTVRMPPPADGVRESDKNSYLIR